MTEDRGATFDPARLHAVESSGLHKAPSEQLDRLTHLAAQLTGVPVSLVSVVDDQRQFFASQLGLDADVAMARETPLVHSVCQTVVDRGAPLVVDDLGADAEFAHHPARAALGVEAYCGVPVYDSDGRILGSMCLIDSRPHHWTEANVALLESLSVFVTETIAVHQSYTRLLLDAQDRLIPDEIAQPARGRLRGLYRAEPHTSEIGGDFYDVLGRSDGSVDIVIGDVVGHGIECAAAAAQLRAAAVTALDVADEGPSDAIRRVSAAVRHLPGCRYGAMIIARVAADGGTVTWARAGALPPVNTSSDGPFAWESGGNPPLGLVGSHVEHGVMPVTDGDRVLFFTDGLVERAGADLDSGFELLWKEADDVDDLHELVERVCPRPLQRDDIALVVWDV